MIWVALACGMIFFAVGGLFIGRAVGYDEGYTDGYQDGLDIVDADDAMAAFLRQRYGR